MVERIEGFRAKLKTSLALAPELEHLGKRKVQVERSRTVEERRRSVADA